MEDFFNTIYYYTNGFYSVELDSYLFETVPGYLHIGLFMFLCSFIVCALFYYVFAPVRKQTMWWFVYAGINAFINFCFALWYTMTPLINNEIDSQQKWTYLDCNMFGITNIIWSFIVFVIASLIIKWGSIAKYVPFQKF